MCASASRALHHAVSGPKLASLFIRQNLPTSKGSRKLSTLAHHVPIVCNRSGNTLSSLRRFRTARQPSAPRRRNRATAARRIPRKCWISRQQSEREKDVRERWEKGVTHAIVRYINFVTRFVIARTDGSAPRSQYFEATLTN